MGGCSLVVLLFPPVVKGVLSTIVDVCSHFDLFVCSTLWSSWELVVKSQFWRGPLWSWQHSIGYQAGVVAERFEWWDVLVCFGVGVPGESSGVIETGDDSESWDVVIDFDVKMKAGGRFCLLLVCLWIWPLPSGL